MSKADKELAILKNMQKDKMIEVQEEIRARSNIKIKNQSFERCMNMSRRELEHLAAIDKAYETAIASSRYELDEKLAQEMDQLKRDETREIKQRQLLRCNAPELKELETKLKCAYAAKELAFQKKQKEAQALEEKIRAKQADEAFFQQLRTEDAQYEAYMMQQEFDRKLQYRRELHNQLIENENKRRCSYEEFLKEKQMIDDIVQRIHDEDERLYLIKMERMKKTKEEMEAFKAAREVWRQKEREAIQEENRRIQEFLESKKQANDALEQAKKQQREAKLEAVDKMTKEMYKVQCAKDEYEALRQELMEAELRAKTDDRKKAEMEKLFRQRIESSRALDRQIQEREDKIKEEAESDKKIVKEMFDKLMAEKRVEDMTAERKRREMVNIRKYLEKTIQEHREQRAEETQREWRLKQIEEEDEQQRLRLVEAERQRLLQEHVGNLVGYLPKGVLRETDLQFLDPNIVSQLQQFAKK